MKALRDHWARLGSRYAGLARREKALLAVALVLAPLLIGDSLLLEPQRKRLLAKERGIAQQSATLATLQAQVTALQQQLQQDPDAGAKAQIAALQGEQQQLEAELQALGSTLVRPEEMNALLERLLARQPGLRLLSLKTLKPESVLGAKAAAAEPATATAKPAAERFDLYRHGVEIRVEGSFADLQAYLLQLERSPQRLLWQQLQYQVGEYPRAEMSLLVYTLSADRSWLAL
ncbi:MAG TPA: hypothetical protein VF096_12630 [Azonexus sp.]